MRSLTRIMWEICVFMAALSISPFVSARQNGATTGTPVQIVVGVEPKHINEIPTITQKDVLVYQGNDRRPVTEWTPATGDRGGLALAILIDDSAGMSFGSQMGDIRAFINEQAPTTLVALGYMQNGTVYLAHDFSQDHAAVAKTLRLTQGFVGAVASPYFSLMDFIKRWPVNPSIPRREVLMISDGIDPFYPGPYPDPYVDQTVRDAQCAGIVIYSIYTPGGGHFGHSQWRIYWGQNYLAELAEGTGGESYYFLGPQPPVSFSPYLNAMNRQLGNQFLLTFLAKPQKKVGTESVRVATEIRSIDLRSQETVCVPASPED